MCTAKKRIPGLKLLLGWRPSLLGSRPSLLVWRPSLLGWRPLLLGGRRLKVETPNTKAKHLHHMNRPCRLVHGQGCMQEVLTGPVGRLRRPGPSHTWLYSPAYSESHVASQLLPIVLSRRMRNPIPSICDWDGMSPFAEKVNKPERL